MKKELLDTVVLMAINVIMDDEKWNVASPEKKLFCALACLSEINREELNQGKLSLVGHLNALRGFAIVAISDMKEPPVLPNVPTILN